MKRLITLLSSAALTGCNLAPTYVRPSAPVPPTLVQNAAPGDGPADAPALNWRTVFRDPRLQAVIEQALANNRDLRIAAGNLAAARANYEIQRSSLFPALNTQTSATAGHRNAGTAVHTGTDNGGSTGGTGTSGTGLPGSYQNFSAGLTLASFELDLFGRVRNLTEAQFQTYLASEAGQRNVRLSIVTQTATAWVTLAADRSLLEIARQTVKSAGSSADVSQKRLDIGLAGALPVEQSLTILRAAQADVALQTSLVARDRNALELIVGAPVADSALPASLVDVAPLGEAPAGLSSEVLLRRPDVVQAEHQLRATNADIGAARAAFFPRISLTAVAGYASTSLSSLFSSGGFSYSATPSATLPIFNYGATLGGVRLARAQRDVAGASYERAIQTAFREVRDALATRATIDDRAIETRGIVDAAARSYRLSEARYEGGIDTFLNALDAQRTLYTAQKTLANVEATRLLNLVILYSVLGGEERY